MSTGLIEVMKRAANDANEAGQPCDLRYGTVISVNPLKVQVSHQFTLPASMLIVPKLLTNFTVPVSFSWETENVESHNHTYDGGTTGKSGEHSHDVISGGEKTMTIHNGLSIGDNVALVRQKGGQKYFVVGTLIKGSYSGGSSDDGSSSGGNNNDNSGGTGDNGNGGNNGDSGNTGVNTPTTTPTISPDELEKMIRDTLQEMIASGEFDGKDGQDGQDGEDGISCTHRWDGTTLIVTSASGTSSSNLKGDSGKDGLNGEDGYTPIKNIDYFDGKDGTDGVDGVGISEVKQAVTSTEDNGVNVVTIKKTDGTTSDIQIMNGSKGSKGDKGDSGYSPIKGTDYWTSSDIAEIKSYVDNAILGGSW